MVWQLEFERQAVKELEQLDRPVRERIIQFLKERVAASSNPRELGAPLVGKSLGGYWKYRIGDWRVICDIQDARIVVRVMRLGNRREVYR